MCIVKWACNVIILLFLLLFFLLKSLLENDYRSILFII
nr:MAG TPA: chitin synthase regulator [Caudoviricetes sp.]